MAANTTDETRVRYVEGLFGVSGMPLLIPKRKLIGEGVMLKMCRRRPKERHFFLFNDILIYGNIIIYKKKLISQHMFELESLTVEELTDYPYQFKILTPKKSFIVCAGTHEEQIQWILHIRKYSDECAKKMRKTNNALSVCPVWIPDNDAMRCMNCIVTEFSWLQRRHHCRSCGNVVCSKCSQQKLVLPSQSNIPLRVCIQCYIKRNSKSSENSEVSNVTNDFSSSSSNDSE